MSAATHPSLRLAIDLLQAAAGPTTDPGEYDRLVEDAIRCLHHLRDHENSVTSTPRTRSVATALAFIEARHGANIRLSDVAAAAEVSLRTLNSVFLNALDTTPGAYIRGLRLQKARTLLLTAQTGDTVAAIAKQVGCKHLGRFAQTYREHYGEPPSRTLRRVLDHAPSA